MPINILYTPQKNNFAYRLRILLSLLYILLFYRIFIIFFKDLIKKDIIYFPNNQFIDILESLKQYFSIYGVSMG